LDPIRRFGVLHKGDGRSVQQLYCLERPGGKVCPNDTMKGRAVRFLCALVASVALVLQAQAQDSNAIRRTPVATYEIAPAKAVTHVPVVRLEFSPGQVTPRHVHPMPVIGYVLEGGFVVKIEGQPEMHFTAGQSIYEPANAVIERYDNASQSKSATLVAYYLAGARQTTLIKLLPKH
jgi:quercetin dioxygenase-like cupin family protein